MTEAEVMEALAKLSPEERRKLAVEVTVEIERRMRVEGAETYVEFDDEVYRR